MKYNIGDIIKDTNGCTGIICIDWNDGTDESIYYTEKNTLHPDPSIIGHWPEDTFVGASERSRKS